MISPNFFGGLLNETLSFSSVNIDGSPAEASVQQYPDAERTVFYQPLSPYVIQRVGLVLRGHGHGGEQTTIIWPEHVAEAIAFRRLNTDQIYI